MIPATSQKTALPLPDSFRTVWASTVVLVLLAVAFCLLRVHLSHRPFLAFLSTTPTLLPYTDFSIYIPKFEFLHSAAFFSRGFPFTYPAPIAVAYNLFYRYTGPHPTRVFLVFYLVALLIPTLLFARALVSLGLPPLRATLFALTLLVCSWPAFLALNRGNVEIFVWLALALAAWAWSTGRLYLAAAAFALAAALKLFPFVFFGLFLSVRDLRRVVFGAAVFLASTLASLAWMGPTLGTAYAGIASGLLFFRTHYMAVWQPLEARNDHSLFNLYKTASVLLFHHSAYFDRPLRLFLPIAAIGGLALYALRIRNLPLLNQFLCLTIASIFLTAFSGDGTLLHLYFPLALLLLFAFGRARAHLPAPPGLLPALLTLVLILTPEPYLLVRSSVGAVRLDGPVHGLLLAVLLVLALTFPFGPSLAASRRSGQTLLHSLLTPSTT